MLTCICLVLAALPLSRVQGTSYLQSTPPPVAELREGWGNLGHQVPDSARVPTGGHQLGVPAVVGVDPQLLQPCPALLASRAES